MKSHFHLLMIVESATSSSFFSKIVSFSVPAMTFILDVLGGPVQQIIMDVCSAIFELCAIL